MKVEELVARYPRLWHMAADGSWPSIKEHGLLSTSALLDLYRVSASVRTGIERRHRPECVTLSGDGLLDATVRDQKPMSDKALRKCLEAGLTPEDWYRTLNDKAFFWLSRKRLRKLLGAEAYRDDPQIVLTVRTETLVAKHASRILLSPINSGSTIMNPRPRGRATFLSVEDYPFEDWRKRRRGPRDAVVELVVPGGIPDISEHVVAVHRVLRGTAQEVWRSPTAVADDGP